MSKAFDTRTGKTFSFEDIRDSSHVLSILYYLKALMSKAFDTRTGKINIKDLFWK